MMTFNVKRDFGITNALKIKPFSRSSHYNLTSIRMISPLNVYKRRSQSRQRPPGLHHIRNANGNNNAFGNGRDSGDNSIHSTHTVKDVRIHGSNYQSENLSNSIPPMLQEVKDFWNLLDHSLHSNVSDNKQNNASTSKENISSDTSEKRPKMKTQYAQTNISYGSFISEGQQENVSSTGRYENIKLVLHAHKEILCGELCIINDKINHNTCLQSFDSDLKHLESMQKCPYHRQSQYSVLSTLNLVKSRLEQLCNSCIVNMEDEPSSMSSFFSR